MCWVSYLLRLSSLPCEELVQTKSIRLSTTTSSLCAAPLNVPATDQAQRTLLTASTDGEATVQRDGHSHVSVSMKNNIVYLEKKNSARLEQSSAVRTYTRDAYAVRRDAHAEAEKINGWLHSSVFPFSFKPTDGPWCRG